MSIDWKRFTFLCDVDDRANVWIYPTMSVSADIAAMKVEFRHAQKERLLPSLKIIPADSGHKPGIAVFFSERLSASMLNIGATIDRISSTIITEGMENPTVARRGKSQ